MLEIAKFAKFNVHANPCLMIEVIAGYQSPLTLKHNISPPLPLLWPKPPNSKKKKKKSSKLQNLPLLKFMNNFKPLSNSFQTTLMNKLCDTDSLLVLCSSSDIFRVILYGDKWFNPCQKNTGRSYQIYQKYAKIWPVLILNLWNLSFSPFSSCFSLCIYMFIFVDMNVIFFGLIVY